MMETLVATTKLTTMHCWCGVAFAVPDLLWGECQRKNDANPRSFSIWCPLGHSVTWGVSNELTKAREELARTKAKLDQETARVESLRKDVAYERETVAHQGRRINGYKGVVARTKRRVSKGVCPCCSAKFPNLKQHMKIEHPHWDPDKGAEALAG